MIVKNSRLKEIDILYTIGTILVILGHSHTSNWTVFEGTFFYHCIVFIYTFHMPLFFLISGILLYNSSSIENKNFVIFIKDKAVKLLVPYFFITAVTMVPKAYLDYGNFSFLNLKFIFQTFFNPRNNTWGHFWYLPVLFVCYIMFGALRKTFCKIKPKLISCVLIAFCGLFLLILFFPPTNTNWFGLKDIFNFAFYVPLGMLLSFMFKNRNTISRIILYLLGIIAFSVSIIIYSFYYQKPFAKFIISLLMLFALLIISNILKNKFEKFFTCFSKNIFSIYIYSWPFQSFALVVLEKLQFGWQITAPIMFVMGICCPLVLITIYKRCKIINCHFFDLILGIR